MAALGMLNLECVFTGVHLNLYKIFADLIFT